MSRNRARRNQNAVVCPVTFGRTCPSLTDKRVSPHVLRHAAAMELPWSGVDCAVIAFWLGHESPETTQICLHADLKLKERAMERTRPADVLPGRYRHPDDVMAYLDTVGQCRQAADESAWSQ